MNDLKKKIKDICNDRNNLSLIIDESKDKILALYNDEFIAVYTRTKELYPELNIAVLESSYDKKIYIGNEDEYSLINARCLISNLNTKEIESYKVVIRRLNNLIIAKQHEYGIFETIDEKMLEHERINFNMAYHEIKHLYNGLSNYASLDSNTLQLMLYDQDIFLVDQDSLVSLMAGNIILKDLFIAKLKQNNKKDK